MKNISYTCKWLTWKETKCRCLNINFQFLLPFGIKRCLWRITVLFLFPRLSIRYWCPLPAFRVDENGLLQQGNKVIKSISECWLVCYELPASKTWTAPSFSSTKGHAKYYQYEKFSTKREKEQKQGRKGEGYLSLLLSQSFFKRSYAYTENWHEYAF